MMGEAFIIIGIAFGINAIALFVIGKWMNETDKRLQSLEETVK